MLEFLIDTHVLIWLAEEPENLSDDALNILNGENTLLLSYASVWEIAIKLKTGKLKLDYSLDEFISTSILKHGLQLLDISLPHIYYTQQLPLHHRDPFDRLLIAQSLSQNVSIISSDEIFSAYGASRIW